MNLLLFLITLVTTTAVGLLYQIPFLFPGKTIDEPFLRLFLRNPLHWFYGFTYSLPLMAILLAHELGHYFACRRYGIPATLPFFIPAPTLVGTFGAVIRIEEPIYSKKPLLDVGSAGPLLSFFLSLPILAWGLTLSRVEPRLAGDALQLGEPLIFTLLSRLLLPGVGPDTAILLHPLGFAGWFGILVTAFNLIPVGQLDGGHILYAVSPNLHKRLAWPLIAFLVALGFLAWQGWWIWAAMIALFGTKHPPVYDSPYPLDRRRALIGLLCLHQSVSGGESRIVSTGAVFNEILDRRPDLLEVLHQPFPWDRQGEHGPDEVPWFELAPFADVGGEARVFYIGWYVRDSQQHADAPRLTDAQVEAMALIEEIANDPAFHVEMDFRPGDVQLLNNARILHSREAYEDDPDPAARRHLLRLWLAAHDFTAVDDLLRGGIPTR